MQDAPGGERPGRSQAWTVGLQGAGVRVGLVGGWGLAGTWSGRRFLLAPGRWPCRAAQSHQVFIMNFKNFYLCGLLAYL